MDIAFLGTSCAVPTIDNGFTSILVKIDNFLVLIDASGNPAQSILKMGRHPLDLDILVLTHYHADHISSYPSLVDTLHCMGRKRSLKVLLNSTTRGKAKNLINIFELYPEKMGYTIEYLKEFSSPGLKIDLIDGNHVVPTSMIRITERSFRILYTSDTAYYHNIEKIARGCQVLIHEATSAHSRINESELEGHSSAYQAGLAASAANVKKLFLCHICLYRYPDSSSVYEEAKKSFNGEVIVPEIYNWYTL